MRTELQAVVEEFAESPAGLRLAVLLDFANGLRPLPGHIRPEDLELVPECQTPIFVAVEAREDGRLDLHFEAPPEAPTTRGFAGVLQAGLSGATPDEVLTTPADFYVGMGLADLISPLRLRGMGAILARVKRQVAEMGGGAGAG